MGTDLGHDNSPVALPLEGDAQAFLASPTVVFPCVVEEVDAVVESLRDHVVDLRLPGNRAQVIAPDTQDRNIQSGLTHGATGNLKLGDGRAALSWRVGDDRVRLPCCGGNHGNSASH